VSNKTICYKKKTKGRKNFRVGAGAGAGAGDGAGAGAVIWIYGFAEPEEIFTAPQHW
jgi:hypothetical protein